MRRFYARLVLLAAVLLASTVALMTPATAAQPAATKATSNDCPLPPNPSVTYRIPWPNGGQGIGCYTIDTSQQIWQSTVGGGAATLIPGNGRAVDFYGYWYNSIDRRICVVTSANNVYFDTYGLDGSGWHGWFRSTNPNSDCPYY